jgi:hypothetical protein
MSNPYLFQSFADNSDGRRIQPGPALSQNRDRDYRWRTLFNSAINGSWRLTFLARHSLSAPHHAANLFQPTKTLVLQTPAFAFQTMARKDRQGGPAIAEICNACPSGFCLDCGLLREKSWTARDALIWFRMPTPMTSPQIDQGR